ncbi:type II secretion system protein [Massilia forsythiae]|uniref:Type II secretion system protein n=1 Tax=Massilia forsythiae TaxID=2728020 RepID=A0A7Z2ZUK5_9BURK|nr:type II secretion system protein [Massilia forsythiae]QJE02653.1 type II secretion system protein [Massilia forsythiae]
MSIDMRRQRGVTLVELIIFIVIIGVALTGILAVMNLTTQRSADPVRRKQALILAEGLLEEVELAKFSYCDPASSNADTAASSAACTIPETWGQAGNEPATTTRPFDNVNDYVSAPNTATAAFDVNGVLSDANGNALNLTGYTARLTISPAALGGIGTASSSTGASANTEVLRIRVEIGYDGQTLALDGYRTRYAPNSL